MQKTRSRSALSVLSALALTLAAPAPAQESGAAGHDKVVAKAREALEHGEFEAAAASFRKAVELKPEDGTSWQLLGYSLHALGKLDEALPVHKKAAEFPNVAPVATYNVACVYALKGETEKALKWLQKSADAGFDRPEHIANDPDMDPLRKNEQFKAIVAEIEANSGPDRVQVYVMKNKRKCARVAWFGRTGSPGQIAIDYTPVKWQDKYDEMAGSEKMLGRKWRLGADFWTSLDTSVDLGFGDTKVPAGYYYLTLEQRKPGKFVLGVHDAAEVKKMRLDAYQADKVRGGFEIALEHGRTDEVADHLSIGIGLEQGSQDHGELEIHFGGHRLTAPVVMKVGKGYGKKSKKKS